MAATRLKKPAATAGAREGAGIGVMQPSQRIWAFALLVAGLIGVYSLLPLGTALELSGDEGYELTKGLLCSKGFVLYKQIWCDQPPLYPKLLGWLFEAFGPGILVARLAAAGFGLLLFSAFYQMVRQRSGTAPALAGTFFLLASPAVLQLSASVMVEVPTIATALLSGLLVFQWTRRGHWAWLVAPGVVMGLAMEIKLTAIMLAPAILAEIVAASWGRGGKEVVEQKAENRKQNRLRQSASPGQGAEIDQRRLTWAAAIFRGVLSGVLCWGAATGAVFLAIALVWGSGSLESSWKSHTVALQVPGLSSPDDFRFDPTLLLRHPECLFGAVAGIVLLSTQGRWREVVFPVVMFTTCFLIHTFHRPWWPHYYLHLAVPLAWLSGLAVSEVMRGTARAFSRTKPRASSPTRWKWIGACVVVAFGVVVGEVRLERSITRIRQSVRASDSPVLAKMKEYAGRTRWVYCQPVIYPFHARLLVPPELAVVVLKRYWSGQITPAEIVETCRRYKPEQILLWRDRVGKEWQDFLGRKYRIDYQDTNCVLFVTKGIGEQ